MFQAAALQWHVLRFGAVAERIAELTKVVCRDRLIHPILFRHFGAGDGFTVWGFGAWPGSEDGFSWKAVGRDVNSS